VGGSYPNGIARHELFAVCEGGTAVQLTSDAALEPDNLGQTPEFTSARPRWCDADTQVSYLAKRWSGGVVVAWGIYTLTIQPDSLHLHAAGSPARIGVDLVLAPYEGRGGLLNAPYDWKPDGTAFVFKARGGSASKGLWRADSTSSGWSATRLTSGDEFEVRWSPASTARIVFESGTGDIDSMDPYDPSDRTTVIEDPWTRNKNLKVFCPCWSPSGTHIVYDDQRWSTDPRKAFADVYRATATGGDDTNLTDDTDAGVTTLGWRDDG
jgi:Tol biopolymer transport system component